VVGTFSPPTPQIGLNCIYSSWQTIHNDEYYQRAEKEVFKESNTIPGNLEAMSDYTAMVPFD
jgi:hypothetical protein